MDNQLSNLLLQGATVRLGDYSLEFDGDNYLLVSSVYCEDTGKYESQSFDNLDDALYELSSLSLGED